MKKLLIIALLVVGCNESTAPNNGGDGDDNNEPIMHSVYFELNGGWGNYGLEHTFYYQNSSFETQTLTMEFYSSRTWQSDSYQFKTGDLLTLQLVATCGTQTRPAMSIRIYLDGNQVYNEFQEICGLNVATYLIP